MGAKLTQSATTARVYDNPSAFRQLEADWKSLFDRHGGWNLFLSWQWFSQWWSAFGANRELQLLALECGDRLVGIVPMMVEIDDAGKRQLALIGSDRTTDYGDVLVDSDHLPALTEALADFVADGFGRWESVLFRSLPESSPLLSSFREVAHRRGLVSDICVSNTCPVLHLADSWDGYLATLRKTDRHELRRKIRRSQAVGDRSFHSFTTPLEVAAALESFFNLHRASRPDKAEFLDDTTAAFFAGMSRAFAEAGWLSLNFLRIDGRDVAATLSFSRGDRVLLYNSGLDPEYRKHSVGIALHAADIHQAIDRGKEWYDFLRGNETYKYHLGGKDTPIYNLTLLPEGETGRGKQEDHN
ncbi:MAG: GNAT family N-acetyltransferase [Chloroflexota bacterium]|jgi:CelD/BcsL family acetyltransferase involved in cellulose biosynthesis